MTFIIINILISIVAISLQWVDYKYKLQRSPLRFDTQYFAGIVLFCVIPLVNIVPLLDGLLCLLERYIENSGD